MDNKYFRIISLVVVFAAFMISGTRIKPADEVISLKLQPTFHRLLPDAQYVDFDIHTVASNEQDYAKVWATVSLNIDTASRFQKSGFFQMQDIYYINIYHVKK